MAAFESLKVSLIKYGQNHLVEAYEQLQSPKDKEELLKDLSNIDLEEMCNNFRKSTLPTNGMTNGHNDANGQESKSMDDLMEPIEDDLCASVNKSSDVELQSYRETALKEISRGHVGVLLLAGGQGTRLGMYLAKKCHIFLFKKTKTLYVI